MSALETGYTFHQQSIPRGGVVFDEDGFLLDPEDWNRQLAETLAAQEGVSPLGAAHWRVIDFVRGHYDRLRAIPPIRSICRSSELSAEEARTLFGGCLQVWRIAGLPNPGEEAKAYMA
ncbi:MAG: TusE/DsrC/DsvC family sulfur relay protein [Sedimenticola sp.]|nr:TusE/DsrC/DsvC family sulfur relay protein [Sedimenticola sp.]